MNGWYAGIICWWLLLNALLGVIQENRAEKSLEALEKAVLSPREGAAAGGTIVSVPAADLVPGDVVLLEAGDYVSADLRLTVSAGLRTDESALTGESEPVEKARRSPDRRGGSSPRATGRTWPFPAAWSPMDAARASS